MLEDGADRVRPPECRRHVGVHLLRYTREKLGVYRRECDGLAHAIRGTDAIIRAVEQLERHWSVKGVTGDGESLPPICAADQTDTSAAEGT